MAGKWIMRPAFVPLAAVLTAGIAPPTHADTFTLSAEDRGWYSHSGFPCALQRQLPDRIHRGWGVPELASSFDLPGIQGAYLSGQLELFMPAQGFSGDPSETLTLFDVSTPIARLTNGFGGVPAFADLGTGTVFGTYTATAADNGTVISVAIDAAGLVAMEAQGGGLFAIGGALTTPGGGSAEYLFGFSGGAPMPSLTIVIDPMRRPIALLRLQTRACSGRRTAASGRSRWSGSTIPTAIW